MQRITLYRHKRPDGGMTVSPVQPEEEYTVLYRLAADEGYTLTNGRITASCVDTDEPDKWTEIADADETAAKAQAYDILTGGAE